MANYYETGDYTAKRLAQLKQEIDGLAGNLDRYSARENDKLLWTCDSSTTLQSSATTTKKSKKESKKGSANK